VITLDLLLNFWTMPFMVRAVIVLVTLGITAGIVGVFVNLRGFEFLTDGLTHAVFPGIAAGVAFAGSGGLFWGAALAAAAATVFLSLLARRGVSSDAAVAVVLVAMFSVGVLIVSRSDDAAGQLEQLLFGRLFTVSLTEVVATAAISLLAIATVLSTVRAQVMTAFDRDAARAAGYRVTLVDLALNIAIALVVVSASIAVGNLLVIAFLIVPGALARIWARRLTSLFAIALSFAVVGGLAGLAGAFTISVGLDIPVPPGAAIAAVFVAAYLLALLLFVIVRRPKAGGMG
jgi:ABC-type Mn2+/Zn2+ transport system permease subunit